MKKFAILWILATLVVAWCTKQPTQNLDTFAQCLTTQWATMYGSVTCSHCQAQKAMFGNSFQYITYVECTQEFERCSALKWVPTREFKDGSQLLGQQELAVLASKTTCTLP